MFNLSLMCALYLQVLNLKNSKIGNSRLFTYLRAERPAATRLLREAVAKVSLDRLSGHSSFGWGLFGIKGQLIVDFVLKISFSL